MGLLARFFVDLFGGEVVDGGVALGGGDCASWVLAFWGVVTSSGTGRPVVGGKPGIFWGSAGRVWPVVGGKPGLFWGVATFLRCEVRLGPATSVGGSRWFGPALGTCCDMWAGLGSSLDRGYGHCASSIVLSYDAPLPRDSVDRGTTRSSGARPKGTAKAPVTASHEIVLATAGAPRLVKITLSIQPEVGSVFRVFA